MPAYRGYDTNRVLAAARECGIALAIPPKRSPKSPQSCDDVLYQAHHFGKLKDWSGVATLYAKKAAWYLAICRIRALALWAKAI